LGLISGESTVASVGIALAATLLATLAAMAWWTHQTEQRQAMQSRVEQVRAIGTLLARAAEPMMSGDELSALRSLVAQVALNNDLLSCRIVISGTTSESSGIVADAQPQQITIKKLPASWGSDGVAEAVEVNNHIVQAVLAINSTGRGIARLEMSASTDPASSSWWQSQAGLGAIGAGSMIVVLLLYRRMRSSLAPMGKIRDALLAYREGEFSSNALCLPAEPSLEAQAWNQLLAERDQLKSQSLAEKCMQATGDRRVNRGDLDAAFDALAHGLLLLDEKMRIKHANGAAAVFLRTKRDAIVGAPISDVIHQNDVLDSVRAVTEGTSRRKMTIEVQRDDAPGSGSPGSGGGVLRFSIRPVRRDDMASAMVVIEDITQQKVAEESRNAFVAHATHELRTPLTNIRLYLEMAMDDSPAGEQARGNALNVINQEARRLERIVGEMLSVSEIEAGRLTLRKGDVRLEEILHDLKTDYEAAATDVQVELTFDLPPKLPVIQGDRDKILVALHNLIGNAIKYTPAGGKVCVAADVTVKHFSFRVSDTGIGISDEDAERIFERFYRAKDARVEKITGTGLGLTLAREVVRLHGGDINVASELNKGSTFTMTLPLALAA
jgi:signal transduction histidine kinase